MRAMDKEVTPANLTRGGLALILAVYVIDSIPNAADTSLIFLLAGCVASAPRVRRRSARIPIPARSQAAKEMALAS
jgi:hypothetical protein